MRKLLIFTLLFCGLTSFAQEFNKNEPLFLTSEEMGKEAIRTTNMLFNSINRAIQMGRNQIPQVEAREEIERILNQFDDDATIQESNCRNGVEVKGKPKYMKEYLFNQYIKAKSKSFKIEFEEPNVVAINTFEYLVKVKFWQVYESKVYEDRTLKGVVVRFEPLGDNRYQVKIARVEVLKTICD